jgi:hypothetical protein
MSDDVLLVLGLPLGLSGNGADAEDNGDDQSSGEQSFDEGHIGSDREWSGKSIPLTGKIRAVLCL